VTALFLDLGDLGLRGGDRHERTYSLDLEPIVLGGARYDVLLPDGVTVVVDRVAGGFLVAVATDAKAYGPCARCLHEAVAEVHAEQQEFAPTARDGWEESELSDFIEGLVVDVSSIAREAVVLAMPAQVVCSAECRGLCPRCGRNLNDGACECTPEEVDGRWGRLKDLELDEDAGS
jgi:uncharacterized protein